MAQNQKYAVRELAWRRIGAFFIDCIYALAWAGILFVIVLSLNAIGMVHLHQTSSIFIANVVASLALVVPVTIGLAALEAGRHQASFGKRLFHIHIARTTGSPISLDIALARNILKVALPWILGHTAVYTIVASSTTSHMPPAVIVLTIVAYMPPVIYITALFVRHGRTPYDAAVGVTVRQTERR